MGRKPVTSPPKVFPHHLRKDSNIELTGIATPAGGYASAANLKAAILGTNSLPQARHLKIPQIARDYGQWVETEGVVRVAETSWGRLSLFLEASGRSCLATVMEPPKTTDFRWLLGCKVKIRGLNSSKISNGLLDSASMFVPGLDEVTLMAPANTESPELGVDSIDALLNRPLGSWTNELVHLSGVIASYKPGQYLVIKDPTGVMRAVVAQSNLVQPDKRVEVWGFLSTSAKQTLLRDAYFAVAPTSVGTVAPAPAPASMAQQAGKAFTRVSDISKSKGDTTAQGRPVRLQGVITYADPEWHNGFIQDASGGIYFDLSQDNIRAGQWVELKGQVDAGKFAPEVLNCSLEVLGTTNLPVPAVVDLEDLAYGSLDAHWLEMEGVVRRVDAQSGHATLSLTTPKGKFKAILPGFADNAPLLPLIDTLVRVRGACGSDANEDGQLRGIRLHVQNTNQIRILNAAPTDPFSVPDTSIGAVATFDPARLSGRRIKVSGTVTLAIQGESLYLQDDSGGIRVSTQQTNELSPGDLAEVIGFPALGDLSPRLEEATIRKTGTGALPPPERTTAVQILRHGTSDGRLLKLEARLLQDVPRSARPKLVLQDGPIIFTANLEMPIPDQQALALKSGSLLQLTGVCSIQGGENHEPAAFRLLLAHPEDIKILQSPQWWSLRKTLLLAGGSTVGLVAALAWIGSLRNQVRRQTQELHKEIAQHKKTEAALQTSDRFMRSLVETLPHHILRKDLHGRFSFANQVFASAMGKSPDEIIGKTDFDLYPNELAKKYRQDDELVMGMGKPFETVEESRNAAGEAIHVQVVKTPLYDTENRPVGLQVVFWDVTARKAAEAELAYERDLFRTLLDNLPDSIYFKDLRSRFVRVSRAKMERTFQMALSMHRSRLTTATDDGLPPHLRSLDAFGEHLTGLTDYDFFTEEGAHAAFEDEKEIIRSGKPLIGKLERLNHLDGKVTWCLTTKMLWRDKVREPHRHVRHFAGRHDHQGGGGQTGGGAQTTGGRFTPGRHGRGSHERPSQRRQRAQQHQCLRQSAGGKAQALQSGARVQDRRIAEDPRGGPGGFSAPRRQRQTIARVHRATGRASGFRAGQRRSMRFRSWSTISITSRKSW